MIEDLIHSSTEEEYTRTFEKIRRRCPTQAQQDYLVNKVDSKKEHFAHCYTRSYPGHLFRQGDQGSEANHASFCHRISFGCFVEPCKQLVACLERHRDISTEMNRGRFQYHLDIRRKAVGIQENTASTVKDRQNMMAMRSLSPEGLNIWNYCVKESAFLSATPSQDSSQVGCMVVSGPQQGNWTVLIGPGRPCQCDYATAYRSLCPCQLIADEGMFQIGKFAKIFHHLFELEIVDRFDTYKSILESETSILEKKNS